MKWFGIFERCRSTMEPAAQAAQFSMPGTRWVNFSIVLALLIGVAWLGKKTPATAQSAARTTPELNVSLTSDFAVEVAWEDNGKSYQLEETPALNPPRWQASRATPKILGNRFVVKVAPEGNQRFFRLRQLAMTTASIPTFKLAEVLPLNGASDVGVTFHPKITFSEPIQQDALTNYNFYAKAGGKILPSKIVTASDGAFAWLFFSEPLPGNALVEITVDGASIFARSGRGPLDADGDGQPGGVLHSQFTTVARDALAGTSLAGIVVDPGPDTVPNSDDDRQPGADGRMFTDDDEFSWPIEGVKVFLLGRESDAVRTGPDGRFTLLSVPPGNVKIVVQGPTATRPPLGFYYPEMVLDATMQAGVTNHSMTYGSEIYLPRLANNILQPITGTNRTLITVASNAAPNLSLEDRQRLTIEVASDGLIDTNGNKRAAGTVGISTVEASLVRDMLPPGVLQHTFDITVQAPGTATFSTPAPMTFPNVFNAAPGTQLNFLSFDHTTGRLVIEGTATVSDDGKSVRTDPGTGVTHPGWHGLTPPGGPNDPPCAPLPSSRTLLDVPPKIVTAGLKNYLILDNEEILLSFGNAAPPIDSTDNDPCSAINLNATPAVIEIHVDGPQDLFLIGLADTQKFFLWPGQKHDLKITTRRFPSDHILLTEDQFYAVSLRIIAYQFNQPGALLFDQTIAIGRLESIVNPDSDGVTVQFLKTLADGPGHYVRHQALAVHLPTAITTAFQKSATGDFTIFDLNRSSSGESQVLFDFDPATGGDFKTELDVSVGANKLFLNVAGSGVLPTVVGLNLEDFKAQLASFLQDPNHFNGTPGVTQASASFFALAKRFGLLPSQMPSQASLDDFVQNFAAGLLVKVQEQFDPVNIRGRAVIIDAEPTADVDVSWLPQLVVSHTTLPVWGRSSTQDFARTRAAKWLPDPAIPLGSQFFEFAQSLNTNRPGQVVLNFGAIPVRWGKGPSLIGFIANTVSHEIAHELGLNESYLATKVVNQVITAVKPINPTGDIMRNKHTNDPPLLFAPESVDALRAAAGLAPDALEPDGLPHLISAIRVFRKNYYLPLSTVGLQEESDAAEPHLRLTGPKGDLLAGVPIDFGMVLADGASGATAPFTLAITNDGSGPITFTNISFVALANGFAVDAAKLVGLTLDIGEGIVVPLSFDPAKAGQATNTLHFQTDQTEFDLSLDLIGAGLQTTGSIKVDLRTASGSRHGQNNLGGAPVGGPPTIITNFASIQNAGGGSLKVTGIRASQSVFSAGNLPAGFVAGQPLMLAPGQIATFGVSFQPDKTGLQRGDIQIFSDDADSPVYHLRVVGTGLAASGDPFDSLDYGNDFVAFETPTLAAAPVLRQKSDERGNWSFFLPPEASYHYAIFDPNSGLIAHGYGVTAVSGGNTFIGTPVFLASTAPDSDGDGLPDDIEFAIGTDPTKTDMDGDGVDDFIAVQQGLDATAGGSSTKTGLIGRITTPASVSDFDLLPDPQAATRKIAYVANFTEGLSIIDASQPGQTILLGQLPAPRVPVAPGSSVFYTLDASEVAVDPTTRIATIGGNQGYWFADVSDPTAPKLLRAVVTRTFVTFPVAREGVSYVFMDGANGPALFAFDSLTGEKINSLDLANFRTIQSVAHDGKFIYVLHQGSSLEVIEATKAKLVSRGHLDLGSDTRKIFAANGRIYVANATAGQPGALVLDVADPDQPKVLSGSLPSGNTGLFLAGLTPDSAGLGVALRPATLVNPPLVVLVDLGDPQKPDAVIANLPLPLPINSGIALKKMCAADGLLYLLLNNQILIVNYRNNDINNQPPTVDFKIEDGDADSVKPGAQLIAGQPFSIRVNAADDVQVREVELLLNGQVVQRSVSFPFTISAVAPQFNTSNATLSLQVRATDRGGNSALSAPVQAELLRESVPPQLLEIDPPENAWLHRGWQEIRLRFSEPLLSASESPENFPLIAANGTTLYPTNVTVELTRTIFRLAYPPLEPGDYRLAAQPTRITDFSGNSLASTNLERRFSVGIYTIWWITDLFPGVAGNWMNPTNWSLGRVPQAGDHVLLAPPRTNTTVHLVSLPGTTGRDALPVIQLASLTCSNAARLNTIGADLRIDAELRLHASTLLLNGALTRTHLIGGADSRLIAADSGIVLNLGEKGSIGALLDGSSLDGPLLVSGNLLAQNGLQVHGTLTLTNLTQQIPTVLGFLGDQALAGEAAIRGSGFLLQANGAAVIAYPGSRLTIAPTIKLSGSWDLIAQDTATVINQGTFLCDVPTRTGIPGLPVRIAATGGLDGWVAPPEPAGYERSSSTGLIVNEGSVIVEDKAELQISGGGGPRMSAARAAFINHGILRANAGGRIRLGGVWSSDETRVEAGAYLWVDQAVLLTPPGQTAIFSGPGRWLATGELRGGSVTLADGAVLEAAPALGGVALNGDARVKIYRTTEFTGSNGDYNPGALACLSSFDVNGTFDFRDAGATGLYSEPQPIRIGGSANFDFGTNRDVYLLGTPEFPDFALTLSSNVTLQAANLTAGSVPGNPPANVQFENRGQMIIGAPDNTASRFIFYANSQSTFTNNGTIRVGRASQMNFAAGSTAFPTTGFHQTASGRIEINIAGTQRGASYGWVNFNTRPALEGTLRLNFVENFAPAAGQQFDLLAYDAKPSAFPRLEISPASTLRAVPTYKPDTLMIQIAP